MAWRMGDSDRELVDRWRAGDRDAATELTARYYQSVLRFFELKLPQAAEDLTQQVFVACIEGQRRWQGTGTFKSYLFGIARHMLIDEVDREQGKARKLSRFGDDDDKDDDDAVTVCLTVMCVVMVLLTVTRPTSEIPLP